MLELDDAFARSLPGDPEVKNHSRQVFGACWSPVRPTPVPKPTAVAVAAEVAELLGLDPAALAEGELLALLAGNFVPPRAQPYAACYGGHQFGQWAGQLGDGRAITLGEIVRPNGRFELQLKGAGPTPYARRADGRAVLRSSVREFLCSEAMFHLGIPTTRALALVATGQGVVRDMFYDGHPRAEPGAVVSRVAPSFLRFGSYEIHAARGDLDTLRTLVDYTIRTHFPELGEPGPEVYGAWITEVASRTARLIAKWQAVGFVHGVLNTDNLSILGLTIDYGPYGWLEGYDPDWTPNTTDAGMGRYRYANQPAVGGWNVVQLARSIAVLMPDVAPLQAAIETYGPTLRTALQRELGAKLGLGALAVGDEPLLAEQHEVLQIVETDWTIFHRALGCVTDQADDTALLAPLERAFYTPPEAAGRARIARWVRAWLARVAPQWPNAAARRAAMDRANPRYVLRNWLAQQAIDRAENGDGAGVTELLDVLRRPYDDQAGHDDFDARRPEWARDRAGCSSLSCSS